MAGKVRAHLDRGEPRASARGETDEKFRKCVVLDIKSLFMGWRAFRFGPFTLDVRRNLLSARGTPVPVGARGVALLRTLLEARGGVVSRAELMDAAWPNTSVEESNLTVQIGTLRKTLSDLSGGAGMDQDRSPRGLSIHRVRR